MRESNEKKYTDNSITEEEKKSYRLEILIKKSILEAVYLFMVLFSLIRMRKITVFFGVLGGGSLFSFYGIAMLVFYLSLYAVFFYNTFVLFYMLYCHMRKLDFLKTVHMLNIKLDLVSFIAKCLSILLFIMIYITTPCTVVGQSMSPTFESGDKLMCSDMFYHARKGDIVVFDAYNYTRDESFYIKRICATEGDVISYDADNGYALINGEACTDIRSSGFDAMRKSAGVTDEEALSFTIPSGMCMVLGDNRNNSSDSRVFGLIKTKDIFGKVYLRILPVNKIKGY